MTLCRHRYEEEHYEVTDRSAYEAYDYLVQDASGERRVEVKGCSGRLG
jgi:hypothetical protein